MHASKLSQIISHPNLLRSISNTTVKRISPNRSFHVSRPKSDSFKVQDLDDFNKRVKNAKKPVIVDFFAT